MIGLAYMNPAVAAVVIRMATYCPHFMEGTSADDLDGLRKWIKRYRDDPRRKILYCKGFDALKFVQAEIQDHDWSDTIIMINDDPARLQADPDVVMVDAELESRVADDVEQTYRTHRFDLNGVLARAVPGFRLDRDDPASAKPAKKSAPANGATAPVTPATVDDLKPGQEIQKAPSAEARTAEIAREAAATPAPARPAAQTLATPPAGQERKTLKNGRALAETPAAIKARARRAAAKLAAQGGKPADLTPEPVKPEPPTVIQAIVPATQPSLAALFDGPLGVLDQTKRRDRAAGWVAARIQGLLDKASWQAAAAKLEAWGVQMDQLTNGFRTVKETGLLDKLRAACPMVVDGASIPAAANHTGASAEDLQWLHARWPLVPAAPMESEQPQAS